jgi:hypothetical protein
LWDVTPCSVAKCCHCFGKEYVLHLERWRESLEREQAFALLAACLFVVRWIFGPEDGGSMFLQNFSKLHTLSPSFPCSCASILNHTGYYRPVYHLLKHKRKNTPNRLVQRQNSRLVFGRCSVRISAETPAVLTEDFRSFPQSL